MKKLLLLLICIPVFAFAQTRKQKKVEAKADKVTLAYLKQHVQYLADDKLEGRRTGTEGEKLAMEYIALRFAEIGLEKKGTNYFVQEFDIDEGLQVESSTYLSLDHQQLTLNKDFFPLAYSARTNAEGNPAIALRESGEPWFTDVKEWLETNKNNPHFDINATIRDEANAIAAKGAKALLIYNSSTLVDNIQFNKNDKSAALSIPVIYITAPAYKKYCEDHSATIAVKLNVALTPKNRKGKNIVGYIDNGAVNTVILGAHYDHLGFGEDKNALDANHDIHNGADDNASGTAALIEIARMLKKSKAKKNNYLFIAFSGEELGLFGSKYWLENPSVNITPNYMINMDMVGRYDTARKLTIGGYGTSPYWGQLFQNVSNKNLLVKYDSSGSGPSDHASFYRKDIPVLFFFTGSHSDYHKSTDDWDKINYDGQLQIVKLIQRIVENTNTAGKLAFTKTREAQAGRMTINVSLGVIPDYGYTGTGMRIEGASAGKLAERLGLKAGDILLQLGDYKFVDVSSYMVALGKFKKGDKTVLKVKRGTEELTFNIEF
jgi:hypothetical protein